MELSDAFWRDLLWWDDHFEHRNCTPLFEPERGEAAITGTDASDWGTGQLVWLDGAREEVALEFSGVEKSRSINWRELLGILRVVEHFGRRLAGKVVLIETDNMAAKGAASKLSSKSEDMQELIRRLLEAASRWGIVLRLTHTPGAKLHRPDQTSRGDPIEEPRVRLSEDSFRLLEKRFGPFNEFLGAEREFSSGSRASDRQGRVWMHPTFSTVGTSLRVLGERMSRGDVDGGVIVVPDAPTAAWWKLTKHFACVGRLRSGDGGLERTRFDSWQPCPLTRDAIVLAFPRASESLARPLWTGMGGSVGDGYVKTIDGAHLGLPTMKGQFVYQGGTAPGSVGVLYSVWNNFTPDLDGGMFNAMDSDVMCVEAIQLTRSFTRQGRAKKMVWDRFDGQLVFSYNMSKDASYDDRAFAPGVMVPWAVNSDLLWSVDHLVKQIDSAGSDKWQDKRFTFDYKQAERELAFGRYKQMEQAEPEYEEYVPSPSVPDPLEGAGDWTQVLSPSMILAGLRRSRRGRGEGPLLKGLATPPRAGRQSVIDRRSEARDSVSELGEVLKKLLVDEGEEEAVDASQALEEAKQSADEAVDLRARPRKPDATEKEKNERRLPPVSEEGQQLNRYSGTKCEGCHELIGVGARMLAGGNGMCHASEVCVTLAESALNERIVENQAKAKKSVSLSTGSEKRDVQLKHRFSEEKIKILRACIEGCCANHGPKEGRTFCSNGCGRGVHVVSCLRMSSARAALGVFKCGECRAEEMSPFSCQPAEGLIYEGDQNSLMELTTGAEGTAKNHADFARLERLWVSHVAQSPTIGAAGIILPRHSEESFIAFLRWIVTDSGRVRSFHLIHRSAAGALEKLGLTNWTKITRVKLVIKDLGGSHGAAVEPDSHATRRIISIMYEQTIPRTVTELLQARTLVMADLELMGGVRVGESCGGGDGHGALANNLCLMREVGAQKTSEDTSAELWLEDSKTGFARYVNFVGKSKGVGIDSASHIRALWKECGFSKDKGTLIEEIEDGLIVERPNYYVVRVSFSDMNDKAIKKLASAIRESDIVEVAVHAGASAYYIKRRMNAKTKGEEHKYVNIAGGAKGSKQIVQTMKMLKDKGLDKYADAVPGPLLRSTYAKRLLTHMPLVPESSYTHLIGALKAAWEISSKMDEPDLELDLEGLEAPKWAHDTFRRTGDKIARATMDETGVDSIDIDEQFGWEQAARAKVQQLRYAGRRSRSSRCKVTMMI